MLRAPAPLRRFAIALALVGAALLPTAPTALATTCCTVVASVSNPTPAQYTYETVYGSARDSSGATVPATAVHSVWYYRTTTSTCDSPNAYSCTRSISSATAGYTVWVDVQVTSGGQTYDAWTSFTPRVR